MSAVGSEGFLGSWSTSVPSGMSPPVVENMIPLLLVNRTVVVGELIELQLMETKAVFLVESINRMDLGEEGVATGGTSVQTMLITHPVDIKVCVDWGERDDNLNSSEVLSSTSNNLAQAEYINCSFSEKLCRHISLIVSGALRSTLPCDIGTRSLLSNSEYLLQCGVRTTLICGVQGSGKTASIKMALDRLLTQRAEVDESVAAVTLCADEALSEEEVFKFQSQTMNSSFASRSRTNIEKFIRSRGLSVHRSQIGVFDWTNFLFECLLNFVLAKNAQVAFGNLEAVNGFKIIVVLDRLDTLLETSRRISNLNNDDDDAGVTTDNTGESMGASVSILEHRVYLLQQLLHELSQPKCCAPVVLIGLTRKVQAPTLSACPLARVFETRYMLSRPSKKDCEALFVYHLKERVSFGDQKYALESDSSSSIPDAAAILTSWAQRLTGLTCSSSGPSLTVGFLPGDVSSLCERIVMTHEGLVQLSESGFSKLSTIRWSSALNSCAQYTPILLSSAGAGERLVSATMSSSGASSSCGGADTQGWECFGGYIGVKQQLKRLLALYWASSQSANGIKASSNDNEECMHFISGMALPRGILLHGPTGCGKSFLASVIAKEAQMNFLCIRSTELMSKYYGDTEASIRKVFVQARSVSPCLLFFDEFDAISCRRSDDSSLSSGEDSGGAWKNRVLSTFLNELDGIGSDSGGKRGKKLSVKSSTSSISSSAGTEDLEEASEAATILVVAACQNINMLDEAILRPGRLHYHVHLSTPTTEDIRDILAVKLRHITYEEEAFNDNVVNNSNAIGADSDCKRSTVLQQLAFELATFGATGADIDHLCLRAAVVAIKDAHKRDQELQCRNDNHVTSEPWVCLHHFRQAMQEIWH